MKATTRTYDRDTIEYIDALLFEGKKGTLVQRDGKMYFYCDDMRLDCGEVERTKPVANDSTENLLFTTAPNEEYGKEFKENGDFIILRENTHYGLVFRGKKIRPLKFAEMA
ncbi:hypothetical protein CPT_Moabite_250 [Serratia phage Moabite]|uniref:Uncharacterized protein n=3 Tax=Moabitevirus TaxID=2843422 RepID=A0A7T3TM11_9CAUD|nr:hypothetical protein HWB23_gp177 [Serratia phage vB_SmaM_ 2050HW]YP_009849344.1 hypothetical protein HWC48_gp166 [Serratia phage Moabite]QPX76904.1 hypothetical protein [Serratia phage vB_SmaM_Yaphecito]UGO54132.1 hypothetical protein HAYMO_150 [Serratia phage vB_SmaM_Haymo]UQT03641.1 hypothetical protein KODAMA_01740 [Serratia phage vB_SmaM-Kodama]URG14034.1 hypothetical protein [Pectobacterium phage vB_ParM-25]ATA65512.1 hypothetical protein 2050HW_00177 [Serratia phage vB_SmaM_ 2050HW]